MIIIGISLWIYSNKYRIHIQYTSALIKKNGFLEGIDKLTKEEASHKQFYYLLSKKGIKGPYTKIGAYDGYHNLTMNHNIETHLLNRFDDEDDGANEYSKEKLKKVCQWEVVMDEHERVIYERAFDKYNQLVYTFFYTSYFQEDGYVHRFGQFIDKNGLPFKQRNNGADFIRIKNNTMGYEVLYGSF
ncbi:MAG: hypothetical protein JEZ09_21535 [Salinivirgaceae bacterium]|nr:hypothetical protein [Salinivirgaceae bacterium]